jgi:molybdopterin-guanine dinucleotide biosynthesis protein A
VSAGGVVLAGGRSSRMGRPKASLEWRGTTLLGHVVGIVAGVVDGPVVVVRAPGQALPALPDGVRVVDDPREGLGPLQGIAAGLAALADETELAYVSAVDVPFLHDAFVRAVLAALGDDREADVALPDVGGHHQPLAAAYRTALAPEVERLVGAGELRPAALFERCRVRRLDGAALPHARESVRSLDTPEAYESARAAGVRSVDRG